MPNILAISAPVILGEKYRRYRRDNRFSPNFLPTFSQLFLNLSFKKVMASLASKSSHSKSFILCISSSFVMLVYDIFAKVLFYIECSKYILFIFRSVLFKDKKREKIISLLVLDKYFKLLQ